MSDDDTLYTPIADVLPGIFRRDADSYRQIGEYLSLVDGLNRTFISDLMQLRTWLSPDAIHCLPPGTLADGRTEKELTFEEVARQDELLHELARWFCFVFPPHPNWELEAHRDDLAKAREIVRKKAEVLRRLPRLMRCRGTPTGFISLFCAAFGLDERRTKECPVLIEHYAFREGVAESPEEPSPCAPDDMGVRCDVADDERNDPWAWRATLLIPAIEAFSSWSRYRTAANWVRRQAPSHVRIDVYLVAMSFWNDGLGTSLRDADDLEGLLGEVRDNLLSEEAMHTSDDRNVGDGLSELNIGRTDADHRDPRAFGGDE